MSEGQRGSKHNNLPILNCGILTPCAANAASKHNNLPIPNTNPTISAKL